MLSQSSSTIKAGISSLKQQLTQIVIAGHVQPDYVYYGVGVPWLQVSLLRMLQYYPPSGLPIPALPNV